MQDLKARIVRELLPRVRSPAQYIGQEIGSVVKEAAGLRGRLCLAFPDLYRVGMSHHGLQVLYSLMNARPGIACQRAFLPEPDMAALLRQHGLPLYGLEDFTPLAAFDLVGFSLQYEIAYTNVLEMLDLGGIPLRTAQRRATDPLVIAGGPAAWNPEPMAPFIDLFVIGDGEPSLPALMEAWLELKADSSLSRRHRLIELARRFPWAYVPSLYEPHYHPDGRLQRLTPLETGLPECIQPCLLDDLEAAPVPTRPIVPYVETIHDRIAIEIMRGCPWTCRFCQATCQKRPVRYRRIETIVAAAQAAYRHTGHSEVSLLSLSSSNYPHFRELVEALSRAMSPLGVSVSVPSLRVNDQLETLPALVAEVRKTGLTVAPEVARPTLRRAVGKPIDNEDLYAGLRAAYRAGWQRVKLYFMVGLPGERPEDIDGILEMAHEASGLGRQVRGRPGLVNVSVSSFVPKPHTPFQWAPMATRQYLTAVHQRLRRGVRMRSVQLRMHDVERSLLEGLLSRGDRRLAEVIERAWRGGARLDAWDEHFKPHVWQAAIAAAGLDADWYRHRPRDVSERLPWDHIATFRGREWLVAEFTKAAAVLAADGGPADASGGQELR